MKCVPADSALVVSVAVPPATDPTPSKVGPSKNCTLPVTVDDIAYHTACVARGVRTTMVVADLPFAAYANPPEEHERVCQTFCGT